MPYSAARVDTVSMRNRRTDRATAGMAGIASCTRAAASRSAAKLSLPPTQ